MATGVLGGLDRMVRGKTVTIKLNMTGSPALRVEGRPPGVTDDAQPKLVGATAHLLGRAGARRIRFVESAWATSGRLKENLLDSGWNVRQLLAAAPGVEFENTNALGKGKKYARFQVPGGGYLFPADDLNHAYQDTDVFVSMAKLKNHGTCGVTLSMKNCFGMLPASIYGDDAGVDEPNENPSAGRSKIMHAGRRQPSRSAPAELDPSSSRQPGYRVPHIVAEPGEIELIHLEIVDGIELIAGRRRALDPGRPAGAAGSAVGGAESGFDRCRGGRGDGLRSACPGGAPRRSGNVRTRCCSPSAMAWDRPTEPLRRRLANPQSSAKTCWIVRSASSHNCRSVSWALAPLSNSLRIRSRWASHCGPSTENELTGSVILLFGRKPALDLSGGRPSSCLVSFQLVPANPFENTLSEFAADA